MLHFLRKRWSSLKTVVASLKVIQFSIIVMLFGFITLILVPQGQDIVVTVSSYGLLKKVWFLIAALLWAFQIWYWARVMLFMWFSSGPAMDEFTTKINEHAPRLLGAVSLIAVACAFFAAQEGSFLFMGILFIGFSALFIVFVYFRRKLLNLDKLDPVQTREGATQSCTFNDLPKGTKITLLISTIVSAIPFLLFVINPNLFTFFGSGAVFLFCIAIWVPLGSWLSYLSFKWRIPVITILLLFVMVFSRWNDNHGLRVLDSTKTVKPAFKEQFDEWYSERRSINPQKNKMPLIVVTAEGGGIRAAYWTAGVLTRIQDEVPHFSSDLFAISSVSGGSLGAAVFSSLLADEMPDKLQQHASRILDEDFLAPAIASWLTGDLLQRMLPFPISYLDRSRAIERSWEVSWQKEMHTSDIPNRFSNSFDDLWKNNHEYRIPSLFFNGTWVEKGRRLITSNVRIDPKEFQDAYDIDQYAEGRIRLSTAVHGSARFTYVSPAGTINHAMRVVDGGYFDNSGATTAYEILRTIKQDTSKWQKLQPLVIIINNDPVDNTKQNLQNLDLASLESTTPFLYEILAPIQTMLTVRSAHASYALKALKEFVTNESGIVFQVNLFKDEEKFPLGWSLSEAVTRAMDNQIDENEEIHHIIKYLKSPRHTTK